MHRSLAWVPGGRGKTSMSDMMGQVKLLELLMVVVMMMTLLGLLVAVAVTRTMCLLLPCLMLRSSLLMKS